MEKNSEDKVEEIIELVEGLDEFNVEKIFSSAKSLSKRRKILRTTHLAYIDRLKKLNCPKEIIKILDGEITKKKLLEKITEMNFDQVDGIIPFIPVIPRSYVGVYILAQMIKGGGTSIKPELLEDTLEVPQGPYYILGVSFEKIDSETIPKEADEVITKDSRMTVDEILALSIHHPEKFQERCGFVATGSRYQKWGVPYLNHNFWLCTVNYDSRDVFALASDEKNSFPICKFRL